MATFGACIVNRTGVGNIQERPVVIMTTPADVAVGNIYRVSFTMHHSLCGLGVSLRTRCAHMVQRGVHM